MKNARDSLASQNAALAAEIADLKTKLATAESGVAGAVRKALDEARASMEKAFDMRVSDRAVEIMASVGQLTPSALMPEGGHLNAKATGGTLAERIKAAQVENPGVPSGAARASVEALYREKYNIT